MLYCHLLTLLALANACHSHATSENCFPYGSAVLPKDLSPPNVSLSDWKCKPSMAHGFQGFSYPLEDPDCSSPSNSFESMNADFARMKRDFGAKIVRLYYPVCLEASVFENALKAGVSNNMAVIFQVWTNFGEGDVWKTSQQAIYDVLDSAEFGPIAPYVVHSVDWGSEPVTDYMDMENGSEQFVRDLALFRARINSYGIPAGISENWDFPGKMSTADGGLGDIGSAVKANSDYSHAHIMPYYKKEISFSESWSYILGQIEWLNKTVKLPTMIAETQWAWAKNDAHNENRMDLTVETYTKYWKKFDDECAPLKEYGVGWFIHTWRGESTFDILYPHGSYVIPNWRPGTC